MVTATPAVDLKRLSLRALVAYAARCARRVRPLFVLERDQPEMAACPRALDTAIRLAEEFAAGRTPSADSVRRAEEAATHVVVILGKLDVAPAASYAANAAYAVICATRAAMEAATGDDPEQSAETVAECAGIVADAAVSADPAVERAARLDWEMLHRMRLGRFPEVGEPINASESGILGPLFSGQARRAKPADDEDCLPPPRRELPPANRPAPKAAAAPPPAVPPQPPPESALPKPETKPDERAALTARVAALEKELADARSEHERQRQQWEQEAAARQTGQQEAERRVEQSQKELNAAWQRYQEEYDAFEKERAAAADPSKQMAELVASLQTQLDQLRHEYQLLQTERTFLIEELSRRRTETAAPAAPAATTAPVQTPEPPAPAGPLVLMVEPGAATSMQLAELLYELSVLNGHLGGPGLRFAIRGARQWRLSADPAGGEQRQFLIRVEATPSLVPGEAEADPVTWDHFRSCLRMTLSAEGGLADRFQQAEPLAEEHHARQLVGQAVRRADAAYSRYRDAHADAGELPIDAVHQHLQKIGLLLHQLQRERCLLLELAAPPDLPPTPPPAADDAPAADRGRRWSLRRLMGRTDGA